MNLTDKLKKMASKNVARIATSAILLGGAMGCDGEPTPNADVKDTKPAATQVQKAKKAEQSVGEQQVKLLGKEIYFTSDNRNDYIQEIFYFDADGNDDTVEGVAWVMRRPFSSDNKRFIGSFETKPGTIKTEKEWNEFLKKLHNPESVRFVKIPYKNIEWVYPKGRGQEKSKIPTQVLKDVKAQQK